LQTAYWLTSDYGQGLLGQGQTIVIVDAFGSATLRSDLAAFSRMNHLPQLDSTSFRIFYPVGPFTPPPYPDMETTLDVEWARRSPQGQHRSPAGP
jgi:subtilase family serine protease